MEVEVEVEVGVGVGAGMGLWVTLDGGILERLWGVLGQLIFIAINQGTLVILRK